MSRMAAQNHPVHHIASFLDAFVPSAIFSQSKISANGYENKDYKADAN